MDEIADLPSPYSITSTSLVYEDPYLKIRRLDGLTPSNNPMALFLREEGEVAVCIPVLQDGRIVLVREYRPGPKRYLMEVPGGMVDPGEEPMVAAAREVLEETGYAGDVEHLASTWVSAYSNQRKHIFIMRNARKVAEPHLAPTDISEVSIVSSVELEAIVASGELTDLDAGLLALNELFDPRS